MKQRLFYIGCVFIGFCFFLISCDTIYFTRPQPIDSKNIYEFPKKIRGVYTNNSRDRNITDWDSIIITKDYFRSVEFSDQKISKHFIDTSSYFILLDNKIYNFDNKDEIILSGGFPYTILRDTIFYKEKKITEIILSKKAFLRQVSKNNYILNFRPEQKNWAEFNENWWIICLIQITDNGNTIVKCLNENDLDKLTYNKINPNSIDDYYLQANWTKNYLNQIISEAVFSDTIYYLEVKDKKRLK